MIKKSFNDMIIILIKILFIKEHVNGIENIIEEKIVKDFDESKKDIIMRKEQLNTEIDNLRKTEFEPNITNKYKEVKDILKNYEDGKLL